MATVRKGASGAKSISKKQTVTSTVRNVRQPTTIGDMADTNFGVLDETKDGLFVTFNNVTKTFELTTADTLLSRATEDSDLPDEFISQVESEINLGDIGDLGDIDEGGF
jgi:hypothetical protein